MTAFLLVGAAASDPALQDARAMLRGRGEVSGPDAPRSGVDIVVASLPAGTRAVPKDLAELARSAGAWGLLLWIHEPMVRPVTALGEGNVVLASPTSRQHVLSALDLLLGAPVTGAGRQALHRHFWAAWALGAESSPFFAMHSDSLGATLVHAATTPRPPSARPDCPAKLANQAINQAQTDSRRGSLLREALGDDALVAHLSPDGGHWLVYWPKALAPLWLYSPLRMPARWSVSATLANSGVPMVRMPAFPGDLLVAASIAEQDIPQLLTALPLGALDVLRTLENLTRRSMDWGFVVEVR
ncbi:MAG: hypothetical protein IPI49_25945 [Myxococcales bacterium]|nr:hypothetical protein [Myxococcales bacterium]